MQYILYFIDLTAIQVSYNFIQVLRPLLTLQTLDLRSSPLKADRRADQQQPSSSCLFQFYVGVWLQVVDRVPGLGRSSSS